MKRVFASLVLVLLCACSAWATQIQVSSSTINGYAYTDTAPDIRVYVSQGFLSSTGEWVPPSAVGSTNFYRTIDCTANTSTHVLSIPSFTLPSTFDASPNTGRYTLVLFTGSTKRETIYSNMKMPTSYGTTITVAQWVTDNQTAPAPPNPGFPNTQQVQTMINAVLPAPLASDVIAGKTKLSVAAADSLNPIAVGDNDPRLSNVFVPSCSGTNDTASFLSIISAIGSNDGTIRLPYKDGTRCAVNTLTIPSNIALDNTDGTGVKVNTGQLLTVNGPRVNPSDKTMFFNVGHSEGDVVITGGQYLTSANLSAVPADPANPLARGINDITTPLAITRTGVDASATVGSQAINSTVAGSADALDFGLYNAGNFGATWTGSGSTNHQTLLTLNVAGTHGGTGRVDSANGVFSTITNNGNGVLQEPHTFNAQIVNGGSSIMGQGSAFNVDWVQSGTASISTYAALYQGKYRHLSGTPAALNVYGLYLADWSKPSGTVTNSAAIEIDSSIGIGTTNWAIHSTSTSPSLLSGRLTAPLIDKGGQLYNVVAYGAVCDGSTNDTTAISNAAGAAVANGGALYLPKSTVGCATNSVTISAPVVSTGGSFKINTGQTLTLSGSVFAPIDAVLFRNVGTSQGVVSVASNITQREFYAAWWGVTGDGSTDYNSILQRITDQFSTDNIDATLILPPGVVVLNGALQDTGLSNAQWVLPVRTGNQLALRIKGSGPVASLTGIAGGSGTILKSTLSSGTGAVIGAKSGGTFGATNVDLYLDDLTIQTVANPTNTALDLRYFKRVFANNLKIWTGESSNWTEPTTSTSYALRTPNNFVVSDSKFSNLVITAFYNGIEMNELADVTSASVGPCVNGFVFPTASHIVSADRVVSVWNLHTLKFTGVSTAKIIQLDIERSGEVGKWYSTNLDDFSEAVAGDAHGEVGWHLIIPVGVVSDTMFAFAGTAGSAGKNIRTYPIHNAAHGYAYNYVEPVTGFFANNIGVLELNGKTATSADSNYGSLLLGAQQSGTANVLGSIIFMNSATAAGDRRNAQIAGLTDGATDSGKLLFATAEAGSVTTWMSLNKKGTLTLSGRLAQGQGATLTIGSNTISPTHNIHVVGTGLIKTITPALDFASGTIYLITGGTAFTMDNSDNVIAPVTTPGANTMVICTLSSANSKWYCQ